MVFMLNPHLEADSLFILDFPLSSVRLMNDARWPWLVLVPRVSNMVELHDLSSADQVILLQELCIVGNKLKRLTNAHKINTAAIGNIVSQLHIHVVARFKDDKNWPRPVWGHGVKMDYSVNDAQIFIERFKYEMKCL
jgi:diadenosine tetraphosphate (Ap4A) HIT family hydrolase